MVNGTHDENHLLTMQYVGSFFAGASLAPGFGGKVGRNHYLSLCSETFERELAYLPKELKTQTRLSNKKGDTVIKGLRKHNQGKEEKTDDVLFVGLV